MSPHPTELTPAQQVENVLLALPDDPDEIARLLGDMGVTGVARDGYDCPISELLLRETGTQYLVTALNVYKPGTYDDVLLAVPDPVGDFVSRFDRGKYPQIERPDVSLLGE